MSKYRVEFVPDWNLKRLIERAYPEKIERLKELLETIYTEHPLLREHPSDYIKFLLAKIARLEDKLAVCIEERERRERLGIKVESPTAYFIDWVYGDDLNDGLTPETAWKTIPQYTTATIRSPGDIAYCRRGQTHVYDTADVAFDEDGEVNNPIVLRSDDGTGWADETGLARTIVDFAGTGYSLYLAGDYYWDLIDLDLTGHGEYDGAICLRDLAGIRLTDCIIHDNTYRGMLTVRASGIFEKCEFYSNPREAIYAYDPLFIIKGCSFQGGAATTDRGLYLKGGCVEILDSNFSTVTLIDIADIYFSDRPILVKARNTTFARGISFGGLAWNSKLFAEDWGGTKLDNRALFWHGSIYRDTTVIRAGGANTSARMEPNERTGTLQPLELCRFTEELSRWLEAGAHSCKMYVRCSGWTTLPTADELYLEVLYYDTVEAKRASIKSTQAVPSNDVWVELSVSFNLYSDSPCYANIVLKRYEAGAKVYVDILPVWE